MMKKWALLIGAVVLVGVCLPAGATGVTFVFNPNDLVDLWEAGAPKPDNGQNPSAYPRSIYEYGETQGHGYDAYVGIGAWNTAGTGSVLDAAVGTDFNAWRNDNGGFMTGFNIWLADNPRARGWGETLVVKPYAEPSATADADGLWDVEVSTNEWYTDLYIAEWTMKPVDGDPTQNALRIGGTDIGNFSFTADVYVDVNQNGWDELDTPAVLGEDYTFWFGGTGVGDSIFGYDDEDYGTTTDGLLYQGTLELTAVPEPMTMACVFMGVTGLAGYIRKRRMA